MPPMNAYSVYRSRSKNNFLPDMDMYSLLSSGSSAAAFRDQRRKTLVGTKVLGTIGPACQDVGALSDLLRAGAAGMRVDLTWGTLKYHLTSLENLQTAMRCARKLCAIVVDTVGRELMIRRQITMQDDGWPKHAESLEFTIGQQVTITSRTAVANVTRSVEGGYTLPITSPSFSLVVQPKDRLYIGRYLANGAAEQGSLYLEVVDINDTEVRCVALNDTVLDGLLTVFISERSTHQLTKIPIGLPLLSDFDKECLVRMSQLYEIDYLMLSYTYSWQDVREAREFLDSIGMHDTRILAKLETRESLFEFSGILDEADGIVISRGNLGMDCEPEKVTLIQKVIIQACNLVGKPVIITRVVDTMAQSPRPTRAEATDVANAVLDGADGILLGSETLRGLYPVQTVTTIVKICLEAELVFDHEQHYEHLMQAAVQAQEAFMRQDNTSGTTTPVGIHTRSSSFRDFAHQGEDGGQTRIGSPPPPPPLPPLPPPPPAATRFGPAAVSAVHPFGRPPKAPSHADGPGRHYPAGSTELHAPSSGPVHGPPQMPQRPAHLTQASLKSVGSHCDMRACLQAMTMIPSSMCTVANGGVPDGPLSPPDGSLTAVDTGNPYMSKLESITSSAVKVADKVQARLILVFAHTPTAAQLVAKYRPDAPIMVLIVPRLVSDGLHWTLEGRSYARQCALVHGVLPLLAAPVPSADVALDEAVTAAADMKLVLPGDYVVVVERLHEDFSIKVVQVDQRGRGVAGSLLQLLQRHDSENVSLALPPMSAARLAAHKANGDMQRQASSMPGGLDFIPGIDG